MYHNAKTTNDNNEITVALAELVESLTPFTSHMKNVTVRSSASKLGMH